MEKQIQTIDEKRFFRLPFDEGTHCLSEETLNANSKFRKPPYYFRIETTELHFRNEILTLSVKLPDEPKKLVYLKVTEKELLVSCNFDTDQSYLSRYAYFTLLKHMNYEDKACFKKFYWPNFFDQMTGRSKYFKITNDRMGFDIELKPKYPTFYKPSDDLLILQKNQHTQEAKTYNKISLDDLPDTDFAVGFCLADTHLSSYHSNHYPFLVPFHGLLSKDRERIKNFTSFHLNEGNSNELILSQSQKELSKICFKMRELAPISNSDWQDIFVANEEELEKGKNLFKLWQQAYELILSQKYTYFFHTRGLRNVNGKPSRSWMRPCEFKNEIPHLVIKRFDKGEYYQIELRFKINGKLNIPQYPNLAFFIRSKTNWLNKYLLGSFDDYLVSSFFARTQYKMAVLKSHYKGAFEDFMNSLAERYEIIEA